MIVKYFQKYIIDYQRFNYRFSNYFQIQINFLHYSNKI